MWLISKQRGGDISRLNPIACIPEDLEYTMVYVLWDYAENLLLEGGILVWKM